MTRPHLILVGTGAQPFREYLLAAIAAEYRVHLFTTADPTWEKQYLDDSTVVTSTLDPEELTAAAATLCATDPVAGILCWDEARIDATAVVANALGLPGPSVDAVRNCRDKYRTRSALAAAGVPQPASVLVADVARALEAAQRIGYPVVLKPRALAASLGVVLVSDPDELRARFPFAADTTVPGAPLHEQRVLVEEYADGPEISIDAAVVGSRVRPYCVARKDLGTPPYFEEVGHRVAADDPLLSDLALRDVLDRAHAALGFTDGMTHTEVRLTASGPKVIEINARIGGDLIPYLGMQATGIDPGLAAAAIACGRQPALTPLRARHGAVRFCYVDTDTTIAEIGVDERLLVPGVDRIEVLAERGRTYAPPPAGSAFDRIAFVTAVADGAVDCATALDAGVRALQVQGR